MEKFFVMLLTHNGGYMPLIKEWELAKFDNVECARTTAQNTILGNAYGFEIFEMGTGIKTHTRK